MKIILIRHAESTANVNQILAGREPGIELTENGHNQAKALTALFEAGFVNAVYSSPIFRCMQTAQIATGDSSIDILENELFLEVDYGHWTGQKISDLAKDPLWETVLKEPSKVQFPGGESLLNMSNRANKGFELIMKDHDLTDTVAIFTHADIIKAIISGQIGNNLDNYQKLRIDNAKLSILNLEDSMISLAGMNLPVSDSTNLLLGKS